MNKNLIHHILLVLRGTGMGAADVVPGVSGGTIAFITGIYEELIFSIRNIGWKALRMLLSGRFKSFWNHINGNFLLSVFAGIFISVISLAKILGYLLEHQPVYLWSFFFGLVISSSFIVARRIKHWDLGRILALAAGTGAAFYITSITPATTTDAFWFIVLSGALASCAMILPGISGSFILLLLGKYAYALHAVNERIAVDLLLLAAGAVMGLLLFSNLLSWLLKKYHDLTIALLVGFMIGSLNKIWPWKETLKTFMAEGEIKPLVEKNVWPSLAGNTGSRLVFAILFALAGVALILAMERVVSGKTGGRDEQ